VPIEARDYGYLFAPERPMEVAPRADGSPGDFTDNLSADSLRVIDGALAEPAAAQAAPGTQLQFERQGYFTRDPETSADGKPVFNKTIGLRDTWEKIAGKQ
jgi:glutaminyl-tRNA synthetase